MGGEDRFVAPVGTDGVGALFLQINRNKRAIRLDLKRPQGREVFLRLAKGADVLVEGFRPGVMAKLGIGNATRVVVYDERGGIYAARLWWIRNYYGAWEEWGGRDDLRNDPKFATLASLR